MPVVSFAATTSGVAAFMVASGGVVAHQVVAE